MTHHIYYSLLHSPLPESFIHRSIPILPPQTVSKLAGYHRWQDRETTLLGKLLLRKALIDYGYPPDTIQRLNFTAHGKPYIDSDIHFNISHSGLLTALVITSVSEVGIDVEQLEPITITDFDHCFTSAESCLLRTNPAPLRQFYQLWTRKEAFLKAIGTGLSLSPAQIDARSDVRWQDTQWQILPLHLAENYICHIATADPTPEIILHPPFAPQQLL